MSPVPALHLVFRMPTERPEQGNTFRMPMLQKQVFDSVEPVAMGQMSPVGPGVFEVTGVPAGRYDVRMIEQ